MTTINVTIGGNDSTGNNVSTTDTINFNVTGGGTGWSSIVPDGAGTSNCTITTTTNASGSGTESGTITFTNTGTFSARWRQFDPNFNVYYVSITGLVTSAPTPQAPTVTASNISLATGTIEDSSANSNNDCVGWRIKANPSGTTVGTVEYQYAGDQTSVGTSTRVYTSPWTSATQFDVGGEWGNSTWTVTARATSGSSTDTSSPSSTTLGTTAPYFAGLTLTPSSRTVTGATTSTTFDVDVTNTGIMENITDFRLIDGSSNELASSEGEGTLTVTSSTTGWPLEGQTTTFTVQGKIIVNDGGDNLYDSSTVTGSIIYEGTDDDPDAFSFDADVTSAVAGQVYESSTETITGINTGADISISGTGSPQYKINSGSYTSSAGTIYNNDQVTVKVTASSTASATNTGTLSIGPTKTADFSVTTAAASSGGSGTLPGVSGNYGLELYGTDGSSILFSPAHRTFNYIAEDTATLSSGASTSLTGIKNATDETKVSVGVVVELWFANPISITRSSANGGTITFTNNSSFTETFTYFITRIG